ncbi:MAG: hypothetical protein EAZ89_00915 [Bacteroidetes bacterium]|nr:MAG: hypothetical protein EAZ89_00915 [Bacteroidota bacterium]
MNMKWINLTGLAAGALLLASCTSSRYASVAEYDDVYYNATDRRAEREALVAEENAEPQPEATYDDRYSTPSASATREPVDNYRDYYYSDDDFSFSRRVRRFEQSNYGSWRYYDPYFSNDLYYVMGTPSWNTWNNNGWYNWNAPRFGSWNSWNDPFNPYNNWSTWGNYYGGSIYGYNPFVSAYYGYTPGWGYGNNWGGYNAFGYGGFGGFGGGYYCPPTGFVPYNNWNRYSNQTQNQNLVTRTRTSTQSGSSQTNYSPRENVSNAATPRNQAAIQNEYLTPRARVQAVTPQSSNARVNTPSSGNIQTPTRPTATRPTYDAPGSPSTSGARVNTQTPQSPRVNTPTTPSTNRPTYSSPSRPAPSPAATPRVNTPSGSPSRPAYEPPSRPSYDAPSRPSYSPSSSGGGGGGGSSSPRSGGGSSSSGGGSSSSPRRP